MKSERLLWMRNQTSSLSLSVTEMSRLINMKTGTNQRVRAHNQQRKFLGSWNRCLETRELPLHPESGFKNSSINFPPKFKDRITLLPLGGGATRAAPPIGTFHRSVFLKGGHDCLHSNVATSPQVVHFYSLVLQEREGSERWPV